jgi:hypothetical protein
VWFVWPSLLWILNTSSEVARAYLWVELGVVRVARGLVRGVARGLEADTSSKRTGRRIAPVGRAGSSTHSERTCERSCERT